MNGTTSHDFIKSYLQLVPHDDFLTCFSKALVEQAVTRYDVSMQYHPSVIACTPICCALQYLEVMSLVDSITVLQYKSVTAFLNRHPFFDHWSMAMVLGRFGPHQARGVQQWCCYQGPMLWFGPNRPDIDSLSSILSFFTNFHLPQ
jgi:hypothetical protein